MIRTEIPPKMKTLPLDKRGYPVPWFVVWRDGEPKFAEVDFEKWVQAIKEQRCWICGGTLGAYKVFVIGPICGVTRTSAEPPSHKECAIFAAQNCPFLVNPNQKRILDTVDSFQIDRNPGVAVLWFTKSYGVFKGNNGLFLCRMHEPTKFEFYVKGEKTLLLTPVLKSLEEGYIEFLKKIPESDHKETLKAKQNFIQLLETKR